MGHVLRGPTIRDDPGVELLGQLPAFVAAVALISAVPGPAVVGLLQVTPEIGLYLSFAALVALGLRVATESR